MNIIILRHGRNLYLVPARKGEAFLLPKPDVYGDTGPQYVTVVAVRSDQEAVAAWKASVTMLAPFDDEGLTRSSEAFDQAYDAWVEGVKLAHQTYANFKKANM